MAHRVAMRMLLVLACAVALALPASAWAAVTVTPADGATVAMAPASVRVAQSAPLEATLARAQVRGPAGKVSTSVTVGADDPQAMVIAVPRDGTGTYRVAWSGMTTDGHAFAGTSSFAVRAAQPTAGPVTPEGSDGAGPLAVVARLLVLIGVVGTAGMALTREWVMARAWSAGGVAPPAAEGAG